MAPYKLHLGLNLISAFVFVLADRRQNFNHTSECYCNGTNYCLNRDPKHENRSQPYCYYPPYSASKSGAHHVLYPSPLLYAQRHTCGRSPMWKSKVMPKIIGGRSSVSHSWPWMARLTPSSQAGVYLLSGGHEGKDGMYNDLDTTPHCGASLISSRHLITAAHCIMKFNSTTVLSTPANHWFSPVSYLQTQVLVRLGDHYLGGADEGWQKDMLVDEVLTYASDWGFLTYDIAILKLKKPVALSVGIQPVCIPPPNIQLAVGTKCVAVGWGHTEKTPDPGVLMETTIPIVSTTVCQNHSDYFKEGFHACAGGDKKKAWVGDSGGGLYCRLHQDDNQWYLYGVTSFGTTLRGPCVFTYVPRFADWIHRHVF
ncbi:unnamed protein product [Hydatigera taeniaeformis]|uniref:Peptidase S1 domain-containing protein n=1 Tax=Hydatigena taeniaeformis TaxID=6205 RepID=A0A0R3X4V6_HYDTA|nr:unnamed protein product [Hydatigera taeniaeformis]